MAHKFNRLLLLPWRSVVAKTAGTGWIECRSCSTCLSVSLRGKQSQTKHCESSHKMCLVKKRGYKLTSTRYTQTLSSDFGAHSPSVKQMEHFLFSRKILFEHGHTSLIANCPFCTSEKKDGVEKPTALSLYINKTTGSHFCKNCGASGTWQKFKVIWNKINIVKMYRISPGEVLRYNSDEDVRMYTNCSIPVVQKSWGCQIPWGCPGPGRCPTPRVKPEKCLGEGWGEFDR